MSIHQKMEYQIILELLSDGQGHPVKELFEELRVKMGLSESQSTGRIHQMVQKGIISNPVRGIYRLPLDNDEMNGNSLYETLINLRMTLNGAKITWKEAAMLGDKEMEVLKKLSVIEQTVDSALQIYTEP